MEEAGVGWPPRLWSLPRGNSDGGYGWQRGWMMDSSRMGYWRLVVGAGSGYWLRGFNGNQIHSSTFFFN